MKHLRVECNNRRHNFFMLTICWFSSELFNSFFCFFSIVSYIAHAQAYFLDGVLFAKVLPWYKEHIRGPHLPFEHLDEELRSKAGWPPIGDCKNNEIKIGTLLFCMLDHIVSRCYRAILLVCPLIAYT